MAGNMGFVHRGALGSKIHTGTVMFTLRVSMIDVEINKEPVELYKILKFEGLVQSGGEAKLVIANGHVLVNGEVETRKRKKIMGGDTIEFNGETLLIKSRKTR
jgi:ribosome-associated protein